MQLMHLKPPQLPKCKLLELPQKSQNRKSGCGFIFALNPEMNLCEEIGNNDRVSVMFQNDC